MSEPKDRAAPTDIFAVSQSAEIAGTLRAPQHTIVQLDPPPAVQRFRPGERFGDFVILRELGAGGFATVYLAHDVTLDRRVALKVSERRGLGEGQALAELEHQNIVQVYGQFTDPTSGKHCLCLQYVPGTTLAQIIDRLHGHGKRPEEGQQFLDAIQIDSNDSIPFDTAGIRNREMLASRGFAAAVCRIGVQMAEALDFAHRRGVLHCDIKPANILVNPYGRPLLADFNVSIGAEKNQANKGVGGTLGYMAPEQLALFLKQPTEAHVEGRSDIYSLGVVLFELLTGRLPFELPEGSVSFATTLEHLRKQQMFSPDLSWAAENLPPVIERIIRRCLNPQPERRYKDAGELALALSNAYDVLTIEKRLPEARFITGWAERRPILALVVLTLLPQLIGSIVNISYNAVQVQLNAEEQVAFVMIVVGYNLFVYPICIFFMIRLVIPLVRGWRRLAQAGTMTGAEVDSLRGHALRIATWGIILALSGWLPGGLVFPLFIDALAGSVPWQVYAHFFVSFTLSGLIALIYSHFGIQFIVLRIFYPRLANADTRTPATLAAELANASRWLVAFQSLAAVVPLTGAVLLVAFSGEMTLTYRLLVTSLIVLGMVGVGIAFAVTRKLTKIVRILGGEVVE